MMWANCTTSTTQTPPNTPAQETRTHCSTLEHMLQMEGGAKPVTFEKQQCRDATGLQHLHRTFRQDEFQS